MSRLRLAGSAGLLLVAIAVGGTIIGSVAAATVPRATTPAAAQAEPGASAAIATGETCAAFRRAFAANLGVEESALAPAAKAAAVSTIDAAAADGTLTQAAADRLKARLEKAAADGCAFLAGRLARLGAAPGAARPLAGIVKDGLGAAAKTLGMTTAELGAQLRGGKTLKEVAAGKKVPYDTVSAAVVASVKADLDVAVAAGTIKQARADRILARLERNLADGRLRNARPAAPVAPAASAAPTTGG